MTAANSQNSKTFREQIGPAIWLLTLLAHFAPAEWDGEGSAWIANGNAVSDAELAERLEVSCATAATWRLKLRSLGLIGWLVAPGNLRVFWINPLKTLFSTSEDATQGAPGCATSTPAMSAIWRVIQERSIALTGKVIEDLSADEGSRLANVLAGQNCLPTKVSE